MKLNRNFQRGGAKGLNQKTFHGIEDVQQEMLLILFKDSRCTVFPLMHLSLNPLVNFGRVLHGDQHSYLFSLCAVHLLRL